ncbi:hypothetical protein KFE25_003366 [Diacronema lutheri]|uniref:Uncharacterized protein n=1 Tax=Diacronema lutheri TaxID=2081491 RepID=A0A8J6CE87_DIALT|nr:hypothetical protein KFE25_003366 [Diacronema lutheri]|mmetsp:Transcript_6363/g.19987  ORF Transcript_6363/g.19987 Transcript_6363/m.19987 type:complete len:128 (-) Transcript_6363:275-658(-)
MEALARKAAAAAAVAGAGLKDEWAKREPTLRADILSHAGVLQPKLQAAYAQMDGQAKAIMDNPAGQLIAENPTVVTGVILPALVAADLPGASLLSKAVKVVGIAEMAAPLAALIGAGGELARPAAPR